MDDTPLRRPPFPRVDARTSSGALAAETARFWKLPASARALLAFATSSLCASGTPGGVSAVADRAFARHTADGSEHVVGEAP